MTDTVFEFPLKEKVRNYLRIEQLMSQLKTGAQVQSTPIHMYFFEQLFTLLDLFDRLDLRTDMLKDLEAHEKSLVYWSQHPKINSAALEQTLKSILRLREQLKTSKKFGNELKEDKFLASIRQRFAIPGGTCNFDLPNLYYWMNQPQEARQQDTHKWLKSLTMLDDAISISLSFLRERGHYTKVTAQNGFYQGAAEDKNELIRVKCASQEGFYPTLSGNKYRYALRFMWFNSDQHSGPSVDKDISFSLAAC